MRPTLEEFMLLVLAGNLVLFIVWTSNMAAIPSMPCDADPRKPAESQNNLTVACKARNDKLFQWDSPDRAKVNSSSQAVSGAVRWVTVNIGETAYEIATVNQHIAVDFRSAKGHKAFHVTLYYMTDRINVTSGVLHDGIPVTIVYCRLHSAKENSELIVFDAGDESGRHLGSATLVLTVYDLALNVDEDRDGVIDKDSPSKDWWKWGPNGHGAILLVNNDNDNVITDNNPDNKNSIVDGNLDIKDMGPMTVRMRGPRPLPAEYNLWLHTSSEDAQRIGIFHLTGRGSSDSTIHHVIGPAAGNMVELDRWANHTTNTMVYHFAVEALQYPDIDFDGEVNVYLSLRKGAGKPIFEEKVVFRVAPWIMTPTTLPPLEVFVSEVVKPEKNLHFIRELEQLTARAGVTLTIAAPAQNRGDRWMQNEIEIGYSEAPGRTPMPVVFSSPRYGGLQPFARTKLLGPDFGYLTHYQLGQDPSSLDSFGNLEVSPPVKVNGVDYPLGRILIGSSMEREKSGRRMMDSTLNFLKAQRVQFPVLLYSDWLHVGHVDEFMTFVPASNGKRFRLLLSSPDACYRLLERLRDSGYGEAVLFEGKRRLSKRQVSGLDQTDGFSLHENASVSVINLLKDTSLRRQNDVYQRYINGNREILKTELGLTEDDIIDLPQLYREVTEPRADTTGRAAAFFPDLVNMLVLGKFLGIPKPFGPMINGTCAFEKHVRSLLEPLGLSCNFLDDWNSYHVLMGEVHCGTQTRRKPFAAKWWEIIP